VVVGKSREDSWVVSRAAGPPAPVVLTFAELALKSRGLCVDDSQILEIS